MTREDSILSKTWVTNDGRYLNVAEITDDHLRNIRHMLLTNLPPGYDLTSGREIARDWMTKWEQQLLGGDDDLDRDAYAAAWIQIIDDELARETRR